MAEDESGLGPALNRALRAISEAVSTPWGVLRPGERVVPWQSSSQAASQASTVPGSAARTREGTPAPTQSRQPSMRAPPREGTPPWSVPSDEASQAPTRQTTPAAEPRPVRPAPNIPETVPEAPEPARKRRKRRPAPPSELDPDAAEAPAAPEGTKEKRVRRGDAAQRLVRRARAWRAREGTPPSRITPAAYDAVDAEGRFGLIECTWGDRPQAGPGETLLVAHTPPKRDPTGLLALRPGDTVEVVTTRAGASGGGTVRISFITRSGYFPPGRPVTSLALGVATAEWARALQGQTIP